MVLPIDFFCSRLKKNEVSTAQFLYQDQDLNRLADSGMHAQETVSCLVAHSAYMYIR